ncbi:MAG: winged helix-turn-helix domain-containing protein [Bdellovibrionales bacterium]
MDRRRLLIASPFPHFLAEFTAQLTAEFEIQRANTEDVVSFLSKEWTPHLLVVDGDSPFFNACGRFRQRLPMEQLGLVLVTRETTFSREERAFRAGCDQVVAYPTNGDVLTMRLNVLAKRVAGPATSFGNGHVTHLPLGGARPEPIVFGDINIHPHDHIIKRGEALITMTPLQFKLLLLFLTNKEQLLSRLWIKEAIWGQSDISLRSIDAQISKLRKLVPELDPHLVNIYGKGYVFTSHRRQAA